MIACYLMFSFDTIRHIFCIDVPHILFTKYSLYKILLKKVMSIEASNQVNYL